MYARAGAVFPERNHEHGEYRDRPSGHDHQSRDQLHRHQHHGGLAGLRRTASPPAHRDSYFGSRHHFRDGSNFGIHHTSCACLPCILHWKNLTFRYSEQEKYIIQSYVMQVMIINRTPIQISTHTCSDTTDDHAADDDTVTALDLRIVKASESVDLFSDRDVLADDASRAGPIRTREQQGPALISLRQMSTKLLCVLKRSQKCIQTPEEQYTPHCTRSG